MIAGRQRVDLLDQHPARRVSAGARAIDQHLRHRARGLRSFGFDLRQPRRQLAVAAAEIRRRRPVHENRRRADGASWSARLARRRRGSSGGSGEGGPLEGGAVRIRGIGRGKHGNLDFVRRRSQRSEQVERARQRKLRGAESGHEVSTAQPAGLLESFQHRVDHAKPAGNRFHVQGFSRHDAVTCEQLLRHGRGPLCHVLRQGSDPGSDPFDWHERPAALGGWRHQAA
jgi:hypothetical protein